MTTKRKREALKAPAVEEWNTRKGLICNPYSKSELQDLIHLMKNEHNFTASKNQYERKLKEWGLRKNLTSPEWEYVLAKKRKRNDAHKDSQVMLHGLVISKERVKKQESRYSISDLNRISSSTSNAPSPPAPEGILVFTPPSATGEAEGVIRRIRIDNLPCFGVMDFLTSQSRSNLLSVLQTKSSEYSWPPTEASTSRIFNLDEETGLLNLDEDIISSEYTFASREAVASTHRFPFIAPLADNLIMGCFFSGMPSVPITEKDRKAMILRYLENSLLERQQGDVERRVERLLGPSDADAFAEFVSFVVHMSSNNLLEYLQQNKILDWLTSQSRSFLQSLFAIKLPAVQACLDGLVQIAEAARNMIAFDMLVNADTNQGLCHGRREDLMLEAVEIGSVEVVKKLLKEGIDVNAPMFPTHPTRKTVRRTFLGTASTVEVARILLDAGARVDEPCYYFDGPISACQKAVEKGNTALAQMLLDAGAKFDPNAKHDSQASMLARSIRRREVELANFLINAGATFTGIPQRLWLFGDHLYLTELQLAIYVDSVQILAALLDTPSGRTILRTGSYRWLPLRDAAGRGNEEIVNTLIDAGADVNACCSQSITEDSFGFVLERLEPAKRQLWRMASTPLLAAIEGGHINVVKILVNHKIDVNAPVFGEYGRTNVLEVAEALGRHDISALLINAGAIYSAPSHVRSDKYHIYRVFCAAENNDLQEIQHLVNNGIDACHILDVLDEFDVIDLNHRPDWQQDYKLSAAKNILSNFLRVCGDKLNCKGPRYGRSALEIAVSIAEFTTAQELIFAGAGVDVPVANFGSLLQLAVDRARCFEDVPSLELVELMLKKGADVNATGGFEGTALQIAAGFGNIDLIRLLLLAGACVNAPAIGPYGRTAFQVAVSGYNIDLEVLKLLLDRGADVNAPAAQNIGRTALQAAVSHHRPNIEVIKFLLDKGADINAPPAEVKGITALQGAAIQGHSKIVHMLLERGAEPNDPGAKKEGRTALEGAAENGRLDVVQLLLGNGSEPSESAMKFAEMDRYFVIADIIKARMMERDAYMAV